MKNFKITLDNEDNGDEVDFLENSNILMWIKMKKSLKSIYKKHINLWEQSAFLVLKQMRTEILQKFVNPKGKVYGH